MSSFTTAADNDLNGLDGEDLVAELEARYGLKADPLAMEQPFFPGASRHHALETLRHLCGFGDLALVVTGEDGAGKTRLLAELVRSESPRLDFKQIPADSLSSTRALANMKKKGLVHTQLSAEDMAKAKQLSLEVAEEWKKKSDMSAKIIDSILDYLRLKGSIE